MESSTFHHDLALLDWAKSLNQDENGNYLVPLFGDLKRHVMTDNRIDGLGNELLSQRFVERNALQCGFCTPGMLLTAAELLDKNEALERSEIREFMSGNFCRCTGYHAIIDAIETTMKDRKAGGAK